MPGATEHHEQKDAETRAPARKRLFRFDLDPSFYDKEVLDALRTAEVKKREEADKIRRGEIELPGWEILDGRYRRLYGLGEGGMGAVDLALDEQTGRLVVMKRVLPQLLKDKTIVARFEHEIKALVKIGEGDVLHRSFIVNVFDVVATPDGGKALVMEYIKDPDLFEQLKTERIPSDRFSASVALQVCLALAAAHEQGVIHRDIKTENIFVRRGDHPELGDVRVRVGDFGLARLGTVDAFSKTPPRGTAREVARAGIGNMGEKLTDFGYVIGTPGYVAPESVIESKYDRRSDLYSLGIVMYMMIAGRLPFRGKDAQDIFGQHRDMPPTPPHEMRKDNKISPLEPIVMKLLEKDPKKRYRTAIEVAQAIKEAMIAEDPSLREKEPYIWVHGEKKAAQQSVEIEEERAAA